MPVLPITPGTCYARQIAANYDSIPTVRDEFLRSLKQWGINNDDQHNWLVVFSEALTNAIEHGARGNSECLVNIEWKFLEHSVELMISDPGLGVAQNEASRLLNVRGYGLTLMRHFCDKVEHLINPAGGHTLKLAKRHTQLDAPAFEQIKADPFSLLVGEFYSTLKIPMSLDDRLEKLLEYTRDRLAIKELEVRLSPRYQPEGLSIYKGTPPCSNCESCKVYPSGDNVCVEGNCNTKVLCFPLCIGNNHIGALAAIQKEKRALTSEEAKRLELIAHCISIAIEEHHQTQNRRTNDEAVDALRIAANLQSRQRQFKDTAQKIKGTLSSFEDRAQSVAGDLIECLYIDKDNSCFLIADVMGKGVAAAFLGGIFRGGWHLLAQEENHPLLLIKKLNSFLFYELNSQTMFVTAALVHLNFKSRKISLVNAGHTAIYLQNQKSRLKKIQPSGPPMGLFPHAEYRVEVVDFKDFERIYMPTDGLYFWDENSEDFTPKKIEQIFTDSLKTPHQQIWESILEARNHSHREQVDDLSLLIWDKPHP